MIDIYSNDLFTNQYECVKLIFNIQSIIYLIFFKYLV